MCVFLHVFVQNEMQSSKGASVLHFSCLQGILGQYVQVRSVLMRSILKGVSPSRVQSVPTLVGDGFHEELDYLRLIDRQCSEVLADGGDQLGLGCVVPCA